MGLFDEVAMDVRKKRAWKAVLIVGLFSMLPIAVLAYFYRTNITLDVENFGVVPDFAYTFTNDPVGITHYDTERYPMVVAVLGDACNLSCPAVSEYLKKLRNYVDTELDFPTSYKIRFPMRLRLIAMAREEPQVELDGWDIAVLTENQPYLVPDVKRTAEKPAIVLIDDASYFRAYVPLAQENGFEAIKRELTRIVSQQSLIHYVTQQNLIWRKQKGREQVQQ